MGRRDMGRHVYAWSWVRSVRSTMSDEELGTCLAIVQRIDVERAEDHSVAGLVVCSGRIVIALALRQQHRGRH